MPAGFSDSIISVSLQLEIDEVRDRLEKANIKYNKVVLPRVHNTQFFMQDPNGINVELNFPAEETKPEDIEMMANRNNEAYLQVPQTA